MGSSVMDWKSRFKKTLKVRLLILSLMLAVVGWFLLWVVLFGRFFEEELVGIERLIQSNSFLWSLRVLIIATAIILIWKFDWLGRAIKKRKFRYSLYIVYGIGLIGWLSGIFDLIA